MLAPLPAFLIAQPAWNRPAHPASTRLLQAWGADAGGDSTLRIGGITLLPKPEYHLTLANTAVVAELQRTVCGDAIDWLQALWQAGDTRILPTGLLTLLHKRPDRAPHGDGSWTLVEKAIVPGQPAFLRGLERQLGRQLPRPPAHVTTHVAGRLQGIGLPRKRLFSRYAGAAAQADKTPYSMTPIAPLTGA